MNIYENCPPNLGSSEGQSQKTILKVSVVQPHQNVNTQKSKNCPHCGFQFRLNVVVDRKSKNKYLRSGCCDTPLRRCPSPSQLLRFPDLSDEERDYLNRVEEMTWFSGAIASVLLEIEARVGGTNA